MTKLFSPIAPEYGMYIIDKAMTDYGIVNQQGLNRKYIFDSVKASLQRLQLDYIDLFQCHRFDPNTPIEETGGLSEIAGYVQYIGMSSCYAYQFHAMQNYAIHNNLTPFISMQDHHSLIYQEREMFPTLKMFGVGCIPWSPLGRGLLTCPILEQTLRGQIDYFLDKAYKSPSSIVIINRVEEIAKKRGISMAQVSLAWSMSKDVITAPVVGTTNLNNLKDIIESVHVKLTEEKIKYLEEPYHPQAIIGH
ncbi:NADP-dependent oxidoreductase domain superfamily protein [Abortiporus biennis]